MKPNDRTTDTVRNFVSVMGWKPGDEGMTEEKIRFMAEDPNKSEVLEMTEIQKIVFEKLVRLCNLYYPEDPYGVMAAYIKAVIDGEIGSMVPVSESLREIYDRVMESVSERVWKVLNEGLEDGFDEFDETLSVDFGKGVVPAVRRLLDDANARYWNGMDDMEDDEITLKAIRDFGMIEDLENMAGESDGYRSAYHQILDRCDKIGRGGWMSTVEEAEKLILRYIEFVRK